MITGRVTANREIAIDLKLIAPDDTCLLLKVIVDTGFNGFLTLPAAVLNTLGAKSAGTRRAALGDGTVVELGIYLVHVK